MTKKLFYDDPYICKAECEVIDVIKNKDKFDVVLKSTPFFPEGGGQPSDTGYIDGIRVEYVYEKDNTIYHVMNKKPENKIVKCEVDYDRRFDHIQQHSGEHMLSAAFYKLYKGVNAGFHMNDDANDYVAIDIDMKDISSEMVKRTEIEVNSYIYRNEPVTTYFLPKEEAVKLPLRKAIKADGMIRIVQMGKDIDCCACCGTQVRRTGEVGIVKVFKTEKYKGMTRIYFKSGLRALKECMLEHDVLSESAKHFSVEEKDVFEKIKIQDNQVESLKKEVNSLYQKVASGEADKLVKNASHNYIEAQYDADFNFLEKLYDNLKDKDYVLILSSLKDKRVLFANNGKLPIECGKVFKENIKNFEGRGGGNSKRAQGAFKSEESLNKFVCFLKERI